MGELVVVDIDMVLQRSHVSMVRNLDSTHSVHIKLVGR